MLVFYSTRQPKKASRTLEEALSSLRGFVGVSPVSYGGGVTAAALHHSPQSLSKHEPQLSRVTVHGIDLRPPVQRGLDHDRRHTEDIWTSWEWIRHPISLRWTKDTRSSYISDDSVKRIHQHKMKGRRRGRGQTHLPEKERDLVHVKNVTKHFRILNINFIHIHKLHLLCKSIYISYFKS